MDFKSNKSHLEPYCIYPKRSTTINHAFASALAPADRYDEPRVQEAMRFLGQDPAKLKCVYCGRAAQTWDHLMGLVRDKLPSGLGHQIGNLVPGCKACNSSKGNRSLEDYLAKKYPGDPERRQKLKALLVRYMESFSAPFDYQVLAQAYPKEMAELDGIKIPILDLMRSADRILADIRSKKTT